MLEKLYFQKINLLKLKTEYMKRDWVRKITFVIWNIAIKIIV